ncbi:MAG: hypothetical protein AAF567_22080 [Actinomycetota bacterium]
MWRDYFDHAGRLGGETGGSAHARQSCHDGRMLRIKVTLDRAPLRYTFVSHRPDHGDPMIVMTDASGVAAFPKVNNRAKIDVVVHAHNLAVRMLDGGDPGVREIALRFRNKGDGATANISPKNKEQFPHYQIMDRCYEVYDTVFASIAPFSGSSRGIYPHGGKDKAAAWHRRNAKVDCRYPESLMPGKLPWVQPQSITTGVPLMHLKSPAQDKKLFGTPKRPATTVPHEYAHALHFCQLSGLKRWELAAKYALWIGKELANGRSGTHRTDKKTSPLIAYIESIGIFAQRYWLYATEVETGLTGSELRAAFVDDELSNSPALADVMPGYCPIATRSATGAVKPTLRGSSTEGAVYGAIFLDFADRTRLSTSVNTYMKCGSFTPNGWINHTSKLRKGRYADDVDVVRKRWRL